MATLTIRDLDEAFKCSLRMRAESRNRSMQEEARQILSAALLESPVPTTDLAARIRARFAKLGDVELNVAKRDPVRIPPSFDEDSKAVRAARSKRRTQTKRRA